MHRCFREQDQNSFKNTLSPILHYLHQCWENIFTINTVRIVLNRISIKFNIFFFFFFHFFHFLINAPEVTICMMVTILILAERLSLVLNILSGNIKHIIFEKKKSTFSIIIQGASAGGWNLPSWRATAPLLSSTVINRVADDLPTQGVRASAAKFLTLLSRNIPAPQVLMEPTKLFSYLNTINIQSIRTKNYWHQAHAARNTDVMATEFRLWPIALVWTRWPLRDIALIYMYNFKDLTIVTWRHQAIIRIKLN